MFGSGWMCLPEPQLGALAFFKMLKPEGCLYRVIHQRNSSSSWNYYGKEDSSHICCWGITFWVRRNSIHCVLISASRKRFQTQASGPDRSRFTIWTLGPTAVLCFKRGLVSAKLDFLGKSKMGRAGSDDTVLNMKKRKMSAKILKRIRQQKEIIRRQKKMDKEKIYRTQEVLIASPKIGVL